MNPLADHTIVLIPTYNEAKNIGGIIERIYAVDPTLHVLVLDDSSPDGTGKKVKDLQQKYPLLSLLERTANKGFSQSYIDGFKTVCADTKYRIVITMDADFSHEPEELPALLALLHRGADIAIGSRYAKKQPFPGISWWRRYLSMFANRYVKTILNLPISDCTSGFIAMKMPVVRTLDFTNVRTEGYGFLFALKYQAYRAGFRFAEHPVKWPERHQGSSKMNFKRIIESALLPWKIRFQYARTTSTT
jgi:dolichol-phosphate mannosyltransferase